MSGINFLSENVFKLSAVSLTTGTENAQFPLENLFNDSPSIRFRSTGNTVVILIDLLQTRTLNTLAIAGDASSVFGMTAATFKTSVTTDFSSSPINTVTMYPDQNIALSYFTQVDHRYVELTLTGQGSYVELGHIFIGERLNIPQNSFSISSFSYSYEDKSSISKNEYGQKFIDARPSVKSLAGTLEYCTKDEQLLIDDMLIRHGKKEPLWVILDKDGNAIEQGAAKLTIYGYFNSNINWSASGGQTYNISVEVEEAV